MLGKLLLKKLPVAIYIQYLFRYMFNRCITTNIFKYVITELFTTFDRLGEPHKDPSSVEAVNVFTLSLFVFVSPSKLLDFIQANCRSFRLDFFKHKSRLGKSFL